MESHHFGCSQRTAAVVAPRILKRLTMPLRIWWWSNKVMYALNFYLYFGEESVMGKGQILIQTHGQRGPTLSSGWWKKRRQILFPYLTFLSYSKSKHEYEPEFSLIPPPHIVP